MDVEKLFEQCLANKHRSRFTITGRTVYNFVITPFSVWCDIFAPAEERDPLDKYMHLLFERGRQHEQDVRKALFSDAVEISLTSFETGFKHVLEACQKGVKSIVGAPVFYLPEDIYGIFDVLERDDSHSSIFGDYHYVVKEIKSAKHIKPEYVLQAAFYNYVLGKVQGYTSPKFYLINREKEESEFAYEKYSEQLMHAISGVREIFNGKVPSPTAKSCKWPWESYCTKKAISADDVSIVPFVGSVLKEKLNRLGIMTVKQLASQPVEVPDVPPATWKKIRISAQAWVEKKPIVISKPRLPKSDVDLFLDFEGTDEIQGEEGMVRVDYLIGLLVKEKEAHFRPFVAENLADEGRMFHEFLSYMKKYPDAPIYHYGPYEKTHLSHLGQKYTADVSHILVRMIDLLPLVRRCVAFPTMSQSLKDIGRFLGYSWRGMSDAQESIVLYMQFLETKERELLKRILDYNEDDVRATMVVKDYLAGL
ncbi:MAG TPA: TM0106 family RecB-like putative nuclease [Candidatus Nanoarchaeia archaeon]|nr:TM0106 family RecB-like putative nuclease [Candidatus Nanoarchaeia archaeon]